MPIEVTVVFSDAREREFNAAVERLERARVADAGQLVRDYVSAAAIDAVRVAGGSGPVPTALNDVRAARLFELARLRLWWPTEEATRVLLRVLSATANTVIRRMEATYGDELGDALQAHLVGNYTCETRAGTPRKYEVKLSTPTAYEYAMRLILRQDLVLKVESDAATRTIKFAQRIQVEGEEPILILQDVLGLEP